MRKITQSKVDEKHQIESEEFRDKPREQTMESSGESTFGIELPGSLGESSFDSAAHFENGTCNHNWVWLFRVFPFHGNQRYISVFEQEVG